MRASEETRFYEEASYEIKKRFAHSDNTHSEWSGILNALCDVIQKVLMSWVLMSSKNTKIFRMQIDEVTDFSKKPSYLL